MKVLITNDSNPSTWYHGKLGEVFTVTQIKNSHFFVSGVDNDGSAGIYSLDGEALYTEVEYRQLEVINVNLRNERSSLQKAYNALSREWMLMGEQHDKALADIAEHGRTIAKLQQGLVEEREGNTVTLPRKVAEAIALCHSSGMSHIKIITNMGVIGQLFRDYQRPVLDALITINEFAQSFAGESLLFDALADGYTIIEVPEETLNEGIKRICDEFDIDGRRKVGYDEIFSIACRVANFVESNIKS